MKDDKLIQTIYKKAVGFKIKEISSEYTADENGELKLVKKKTVSKDVAPDLGALRFLLESDLNKTDYSLLSDNQLKKEARILLSRLESTEDEED